MISYVNTSLFNEEITTNVSSVKSKLIHGETNRNRKMESIDKIRMLELSQYVS